MKANFPAKNWKDRFVIFLHERLGVKVEWITGYTVVGSTIIFNKKEGK